MKVSVVTVCLNQAHFIKRAIESVRKQDYPWIEHIVVDPGSTDGSRKIIEEYHKHFARIIMEPDHGPADGLCKGFKAATGEILAQLNGDDCYLPGAISRVISEFREDPQLGVIYGDGLIADLRGMPLKHAYADQFSVRGYAYGRVAVFQQSTFYTRWAYERVGGLNLSNQTSWDGELMVDFALNEIPMKKIDANLGVFSYYPDSISGSRRLINEYTADQDRIFVKITGRQPSTLDRLLRTGGKLLRLTKTPAILKTRLHEIVFGSKASISSEALEWLELKKPRAL